MLPLVLIVSGGIFALAAAYGAGLIVLRSVPAPGTIVFAVGAAIFSLMVFLLLVAGVARPVSFGVLGAVTLAPLFILSRKRLSDPVKAPLSRGVRYLFLAIFSSYGFLYLVHALAPEIQPDGIGYHLGLVREYLRLGGFPSRVGFYEMVPQGMEMLFLAAYAIGQHSAAKLVHAGFLFASVPMILQLGRRLRQPDRVSLGAAALYFCAPVVGVSGTSSYNDAALVFFVLATFYLLLVWRDENDGRYLWAAGLAAGFCYAIKFSGIVVLPLAVLFVIISRNSRKLPALILGGLLMIAPWMARNTLMSRNPLAPLFIRWFPQHYFHASMEEDLARGLSSYGGVKFWETPWELAYGGRLHGTFGLVLLLLPIGLFALRRRSGRLCWLAASVLALPWAWNIGARFLMPAFPILALAFTSVLPVPVLSACLFLQAVTSWPSVLNLYGPAHTWRLRGVPIRAALRLEPEGQYLWDQLDDYKIARMILEHTSLGERIFALMPVAKAYMDREILEFWHSSEGDRLADVLRSAGFYQRAPLYNLTASWPAQPLLGVRARLTKPHPGEWCIHEVRLFSGEDQVFSEPHWNLRFWPNRRDAPFAFDENLATRWRTWEPMRPGMFMEADFDRPQVLTDVVLISHTPVYKVPVEIFGLRPDGKWHLLSNRPEPIQRPPEDLRKAATRGIKRAGFRYILTPTASAGMGPLGDLIAGREAEWGLELVGEDRQDLPVSDTVEA